MGKFRRSGFKAYRRIAAGPVLPTWVKAVPFVLGAVLFFLVSSAMFSSSSVEVQNQDVTRAEIERIAGDINTDEFRQVYELATTGTLPAASSDTPESPASSVPVDVPDSTGVVPGTAPGSDLPAPPAEELSVQLLDRTGMTIPVPEAALAAARAATAALFTGRFDTVPVADGVSVPTLPRLWDDPYVGEPTVDSVGDSVFSIAFVVDPDRDGPALPREIVASVENVGPSTWVWLGV